jgi:hypothetical protein
MIETIIGIFKKNWILTIILIVGLLFILFPRQIRRIFGTPRKRRRRRTVPAKRIRSRTRSGKPLPRSVGYGGTKAKIRLHGRTTTKGYPAVGGGYIPFKYNKDGSVKKAWQVGGTIAAKNKMSKLRRAK